VPARPPISGGCGEDRRTRIRIPALAAQATGPPRAELREAGLHITDNNRAIGRPLNRASRLSAGRPSNPAECGGQGRIQFFRLIGNGSERVDRVRATASLQ